MKERDKERDVEMYIGHTNHKIYTDYTNHIWETQSRTCALHPHLQTTYFCCPDCGAQFKETLTYISNTIHNYTVNPGVNTFVPSPRELIKKRKVWTKPDGPNKK